MRFSTYRYITVIACVAVTLLVGVLLGTISPSLGIAYVVVVLIVGIPLTWLYFAQMRLRLDDYGGQFPMPGIWGILGVDLTDDDYVEGSSGPHDDGLVGYDSNELPGDRPVRWCPFCHAELAKANPKFCNDCGRALPSSVQAGPSSSPLS